MEQQPHPAMGDGSQVYPASAYPPAGTVAPGVIPAGSQPILPPPLTANQAQLSAQNQLLYEQSQQFQQQLQQQQQTQLRQFWAERLSEIEEATDIKTHTLPLARIKKIMKADEDVRMISADAPLIFAKACEMFVLELTLRSWMHTEENKRRTLQKNDVAAAISRTDVYDFLVDIVPRDEMMKEEGAGLPRAGLPAAAEAYQYYYAQQAPGAAMVYGEQQGQPVNYRYQEPQEQQQQQQGTPAEQQSFDGSG
uniref:Uncharacterized protein n=1 Tax=Avena sativa TaxID=4498 RepID=A0ACD5ZEY0_AVESA